MSTYITLAEAKIHLRVDYTEDDTYVQSLCDMVEEAVAIEIEADLADIAVESVLPLRLKQAMLLMVGHFYMMREPIIVGVSVAKIPYGFDFLISPFKNYIVA